MSSNQLYQVLLQYRENGIPGSAWNIISYHPDLSWECFLKHPEWPWDWNGISLHPDLDWNLVAVFPKWPWTYEYLLGTVPLAVLDSHPDLPWKSHRATTHPIDILKYPNIKWHYNKEDYEYMIAHPELPWPYEEISSESEIDCILFYPQIPWVGEEAISWIGTSFVNLKEVRMLMGRYPEWPWTPKQRELILPLPVEVTAPISIGKSIDNRVAIRAKRFKDLRADFRSMCRLDLYWGKIMAPNTQCKPSIKDSNPKQDLDFKRVKEIIDKYPSPTSIPERVWFEILLQRFSS